MVTMLLLNNNIHNLYKRTNVYTNNKSINNYNDKYILKIQPLQLVLYFIFVSL